VGYTALLLLDLVPSFLADKLFWDGARLHVLWHPNITACFLMIGIGFAAAFLTRTRKLLHRVLLAAALLVQFVAMALTNCRTTILMTGALFGGILFFLIAKGGWKRFVLGLLAAVLALTVSFKVSSVVYKGNNDRLMEIIQTQADTSSGEDTNAVVHSTYTENEILQGDNGQGTLANDMRTLNGRTYIWKAAFSAIRDSKVLALFGTEYAGTVISVYNPFEVVHAHNAWMEALVRMGLPGLLLSLVFTAVSVCSAVKLLLNGAVELWKKIVVMLTMCLMAAGFLEPYLFITNVYYHVTDAAFFFLTGYLDYWANAAPKENA